MKKVANCPINSHHLHVEDEENKTCLLNEHLVVSLSNGRGDKLMINEGCLPNHLNSSAPMIVKRKVSWSKSMA